MILGCTEIEILVGPEDSPVPVFPTTRLHVGAAVEQAIAPAITQSNESGGNNASPLLAPVTVARIRATIDAH